MMSGVNYTFYEDLKDTIKYEKYKYFLENSSNILRTNVIINAFRILDFTDQYNNIIEKIILLIIDLGDNILNIIYDESKKPFTSSLNHVKKLELLQKINNYISKTIKNTKIVLLKNKIYSCLYSTSYNIIYDKRCRNPTKKQDDDYENLKIFMKNTSSINRIIGIKAALNNVRVDFIKDLLDEFVILLIDFGIEPQRNIKIIDKYINILDMPITQNYSKIKFQQKIGIYIKNKFDEDQEKDIQNYLEMINSIKSSKSKVVIQAMFKVFNNIDVLQNEILSFLKN